MIELNSLMIMFFLIGPAASQNSSNSKVNPKILHQKLASVHGLGKFRIYCIAIHTICVHDVCFYRYKLPFDRHDWVVDRCGEKVTYVIDFYSGKANPNVPGSVSFFLDVRPALSPAGVWDRIKMSFEKGQWL
jgi:Cytochrome c/c1 heme lyase